jgi:site-specific recombinase XerC
LLREAVKDKSYRALPLGQEFGHYLRANKKRFTRDTYRDYESCGDKLARFFADLQIEDFEPPIGTERVEDFLDAHWGESAGRTYNKNLTITREFFKHEVLRGKLHGDPTLPITRARKGGVYRTTFSGDQVRGIIAAQTELRERLVCRLILMYGLRKGAVKSTQFDHFDHMRKRLTVFTKGDKVLTLPIPDPMFWLELERLIFDVEAQPHHYLMPRRLTRATRYERKADGSRVPVEWRVKYFPDEHMSEHSLHDWWYECLERAGIVQAGVTRGERMHKGRHTAGQRVLDKTKGNLKAVQKLLGHADISTTGNIYTDWDIDQLAETLKQVLEEEDGAR